MTIYPESEYLQLSGLQHFAFCRRQWALIHIEQQWADNLRTVEGELLHERCHDERQTGQRAGLLTVRGMRVFSASLGISGACDVVEFHPDPDGIPLFGRPGLWRPVPIEYKRGAPKPHDADALQLCAQAMCLEEMLACPIPAGALFYGETRRRQPVDFTDSLRQTVRTMLEEMHGYFSRGYTPVVRPTKSCNACSLKNLCLPKLYRKRSAKAYLAGRIEEDASCENC
ncbi:MAG: CRISPR-associated protein Cas4 [Clostridiales bacterium]|nr:CRISPR-associated protein Cas4 [Clostridiales bacterium]